MKKWKRSIRFKKFCFFAERATLRQRNPSAGRGGEKNIDTGHEGEGCFSGGRSKYRILIQNEARKCFDFFYVSWNKGNLTALAAPLIKRKYTHFYSASYVTKEENGKKAAFPVFPEQKKNKNIAISS